MSRKTLIQTVNAVMRLLRRSEVGSCSDTPYSRLVCDLVNDAVEHVEGEYRWSALYTETSFSTVSGTQEYALTSWQDRGVLGVADETSKQVRPGKAIRLVDGSANYYPVVKSDQFFNQLSTTIDNARPYYYRPYAPDSSGDLQVQFYPTPDAAYSCTAYGYVGQGSITADATLLLVPSTPVILFAFAQAIRERGEDGGTSAVEVLEQAEDALQKAIDVDQGSRAGGNVFAWSVV